MAGVRFPALQSRPMEFLDFTSLTLEEFQQLVPPFEAAFHAWMAAWRLDGKPRTARRFTVNRITSWERATSTNGGGTLLSIGWPNGLSDLVIGSTSNR